MKTPRKPKTKKVYVCGTNWIWEIGEGYEESVYNSPQSVRKERCCYKECGIAELEVSFKRWVRKPEKEKITK